MPCQASDRRSHRRSNSILACSCPRIVPPPYHHGALEESPRRADQDSLPSHGCSQEKTDLRTAVGFWNLTQPLLYWKGRPERRPPIATAHIDRKSTRLNSSHRCISYAVFCLK